MTPEEAVQAALAAHAEAQKAAASLPAITSPTQLRITVPTPTVRDDPVTQGIISALQTNPVTGGLMDAMTAWEKYHSSIDAALEGAGETLTGALDVAAEPIRSAERISQNVKDAVDKADDLAVKGIILGGLVLALVLFGVRK